MSKYGELMQAAQNANANNSARTVAYAPQKTDAAPASTSTFEELYKAAQVANGATRISPTPKFLYVNNRKLTPYAQRQQKAELGKTKLASLNEQLKAAQERYGNVRRSYGTESYNAQEETELKAQIDSYKDQIKAAEDELGQIEGWLTAYDNQIEGGKAWEDAQRRGLDSFAWYDEAKGEYDKAQSALDALYKQKGAMDSLLEDKAFFTSEYQQAVAAGDREKAAAMQTALTEVENQIETDPTNPFVSAGFDEQIEAAIRARDEAEKLYGYAQQYRYASTPTGTGSIALGKAMARQLDEQRAREYERQYGKVLDETSRGAQVGGGAGGFDKEYTILKYDTSFMQPKDNWTEDELNTYYGLLSMSYGTGDTSSADEYARVLNDRKQAAANQEKALEIGENATSSFWSGAGHTVAAAGAGLLQGIEYLGDMRELSARGVITEKAFGLADYNAAVTGSISQHLNDTYGTLGDEAGILAGKGWGDAYNVAVSVGQSWAAMAITGGSSALVSTMFFGQAAKSTLDAQLAKGVDPYKAVTVATLSGVAEVLGEALPLENIRLLQSGVTKGYINDILRSAAIEGGEEVFTSFANFMVDRIANGSDSAYYIALEGYVSQGMSYEEAQKAATKDFLKGLTEDFIAGGISGAVGGGVLGPAARGVHNATTDFAGDAQGLIDVAASYEGTKAASLAGKYEAGLDAKRDKADEILDRKIEYFEKLAQTGSAKDRESAAKRVEELKAEAAQRAQDREQGKRDSTLSIRQANRLTKAISEAQNQRNSESIKASIAQELESRGVENFQELAEIIHKSGRGKGLSDSEIKTLQSYRPAWQMREAVMAVYPKGRLDESLVKNGPAWMQKAELLSGEDIAGHAAYDSPTMDIAKGAAQAAAEAEVAEGAGVEAYAKALGEFSSGAVRLYDGSTDPREYITNMDVAINAVAANVGSREAFDKSESAQALTEEQRDFAWEAGQKLRGDTLSVSQRSAPSVRGEGKGKAGKQQGKKKGSGKKRGGKVSSEGVTVDGVRYKSTTLDRVKPEDLRVVRALAETFDVNVVFYESEADIKGKYQGANGFYHKGTIYLDVHAGARDNTQKDAVLLTAAHELTHFIAENAEAEFKTLKEFVVEYLLEHGQDFENMVQQKMKAYEGRNKLDYEGAVEEVVADACEMVLKDSKAVELIRKEKPSLFKTIAEWLKQFAEDIRKAFEGVEARNREAKAMNDALEELTKLWDTAAVAAAKNEGNKKTPGKGEGVKYSKKPENSTIKNQIAASSERLNAIAPVATVNASNLPKGGKNVRAWAVNLLKATGYKVDRQNFGTIEFSPKHIAEGIKYLSEDAELAAFSALPKVLKRGIIIDSHEKHKGNLRDSVTIAAPIVINGVRGNMAVAITVTTKNHYHVHRVVMPDGSKFTFDVNKKEAEPTMYSAAKAGEETKSSTYNENVPQAGRKVKYSQRDSEGNELSKEQQEYFKDSKARDAEGRLQVVYHGARDTGRTVFTRNVTYFTDDESMADSYSPNGGRYKGYVNITKPFVVDAEGGNWSRVPVDGELLGILRESGGSVFEEDGEWRSTPADIAASIEELVDEGEADYDGVIILNVDDTGSYYKGKDTHIANDYIIFNSNQFKNVDNLKPSSSPDIRYSQRDSREGLTKEEARAQAQAYTVLKAENAYYRERWEWWKNQTRKTKVATVRKADTDRYARYLVNLHDAKEADLDWVKERLKALGDYFVQQDKDSLDYDEMWDMAWEVATEIAENAEAYEDVAESFGVDAEDVKDSIRRAEIYMSPSDIKALPEGFRRRYRGKIHISSDAERGVDSYYKELNASYGETLFPSDIINPEDQMIMIGEAWDKVTAEPKVYNPNKYHMNEAINNIALDILNMFYGETGSYEGEIRTTPPTFADKAEAKLEQVKAEDREKLAKLRDEKNAKLDKQHKEEVQIRKEMRAKEKAVKWDKYYSEVANRQDAITKLRADKNARMEEIRREEAEKRREAVARERAAKWDKYEQVKAYYQKQIADSQTRRKENAAAKKYRDRVFERVDTLSRWLQVNSDKEHIPEGLKTPVIEFLNSLDLSSKQQLKGKGQTKRDVKYTEALGKLKDILANQQRYINSGEGDGLDVYLDLPSGFDAEIAQHIDSVRGILKGTDIDLSSPVVYMTADQLKDLDFILGTLTHSIRQINRFITDSRYASVEEGARETREYLKSLGERKGGIKPFEAIDKYVEWGNALPYYAFKRFGHAGMERFMAIAQGWGKMAVNMERLKNYSESVYKGEEARKWENTVHSIELSSGRTVQMSEAQMMGVWCMARREQGLKHLLGGGMRLADIEIEGGSKISQTTAAQLTQDDLAKIGGMLSDRQIVVATKLQQFMNTVCSDWGNEVSMARHGYRAFKEQFYYPITTDPNNHPAVDPQVRENDIFRLLNLSFTKALTPNANNSVVIFSVFDVFAGHATDMAKFNALALPILDLIKWYNHKDKTYTDVPDSMGNTYTQIIAESVQQSVETAYGKNAQMYVVNFLKDLNGKREGGRGEGALRGIIANYKRAAVAANLRVAAQQPTSIIRAAYAIAPGYIARGAAMSGGIEEALKYSGLAKWKDMGFFDTNIARGMREQIKHTESTMDKLVEKSMELAKLGDRAVWGALWNAAKLEVRETQKLKGEELMEATARRFEEIILATQVMDSTISRSELMRNQSIALAEITSFMSEPTVSANILMDASDNINRLRRTTGSASTAARMGSGKAVKAVTVFALNAATTAAVAAIVDALRDDDEYQEFSEKWTEHVFENFKQNINPAGIVPLIGDIVQIFTEGETPDSLIFAPFTQAKKAVDSAAELWKLMLDPNAETDSSYTNWGRAYNIAQGISSMSGVPVAAGFRELKALWNISGGLITGKKLKFYDSGVKNSIKYGVKDGYIDEEEAVTLLVENGEASDEDAAYWMVQEWLHADDREEWTRYGELYAAMVNDDMQAFEEALDALAEHGIAGGTARSAVESEVKRLYQGADGQGQLMDKETSIKTLQKYGGMGELEARRTVEQWTLLITRGFAYEDIGEQFVRGNITERDAATLYKEYGMMTERDAKEKVQQLKLEKDHGIRYSYLGDAYIYGEITEQQAIDWQMKYGGLSREEAEAKITSWDMKREYGVETGSTTNGIKAYLVNGIISEETAYDWLIADGNSPEKAEDYVYQYLFTKETGYSFGDIGEAYADGVITFSEMVEWYKNGSIYTHGSEEVAEEYAEVERWKATIPGAEAMNRDGLEKFEKYGKYMTRAGLDEADFAAAWAIYSEAEAQYDSQGNKVKEKAEVFFDDLYELVMMGAYSREEANAIARTMYTSKYINRYKKW